MKSRVQVCMRERLRVEGPVQEWNHGTRICPAQLRQKPLPRAAADGNSGMEERVHEVCRVAESPETACARADFKLTKSD